MLSTSHHRHRRRLTIRWQSFDGMRRAAESWWLLTCGLVILVHAEICGAHVADSTGYLLTSAIGSSHADKHGVDVDIEDSPEQLFSDDYNTGDVDDDEMQVEEWAGEKAGRRGHKAANKGSATQPAYEDERIDTEEVFGQGRLSDIIGTHGETRDFLHFLRRIRYDHRQCPDNDGEAVEIEVSIVVTNIRGVSEISMDGQYELIFRESWSDFRLRYDIQKFKNKTELALHESYINFLWHPDTFMPNALASKNPQKQSISHRSLLRLQSTGRVLYSRRISILAECPMDLVLFPFDTQVCKLGVESYGMTADKVTYKWSKGNVQPLVIQKIRLPDFQITDAFITSQLESYATGDYSRLYVCFVFSRSSGFCFLQLIIPATAVVITSWISLWMESETEFQDMVSIILAITFLIFSYNEMMPRVSYIKAMDIYLGVCFMIVFLSLIKLAIFKYVRHKLQIQINRQEAAMQSFVPVLRMSTGSLEQVNGNSTPMTATSGFPDVTFTLSPDVESNNNNNCRPPSRRPSMLQYQAINVHDPELRKRTKATLFAGLSKYRHISRYVPKITYTKRGVRRCHILSQMSFFLFFVLFIFFYFLFYPNVYYIPTDPACVKENAEATAPIP